MNINTYLTNYKYSAIIHKVFVGPLITAHNEHVNYYVGASVCPSVRLSARNPNLNTLGTINVWAINVWAGVNHSNLTSQQIALNFSAPRKRSRYKIFRRHPTFFSCSLKRAVVWLRLGVNLKFCCFYVSRY